MAPMNRREMLATTSATLLGLSAACPNRVAADEKKPPKLLYFTRSVGFEHSVVHTGPDGLSHSDRVLTDLGKQAGFEVVPSKDGRLFDEDLKGFDGFVFYTCGDLSQPSLDKSPPMSAEGKKRLVEAVADGKPFVGIHSSCYWGPDAAPDDPYLAMVGAEFVSHGAQQEATMRVVSPGSPGTEGLGDSFRLLDEWYALRDFSEPMHVILVQETQGMEGGMYQRPPFPATWARTHGKGRVFFTSMGHREDVWTNKIFQQILVGGIHWALGRRDAGIENNLQQVTPKAEQLAY
jgi:type 1 glutamine amidotransferase